jgi:microcystin-dependent protein
MKTASHRVQKLIQHSLSLLACTLSLSAFACPSEALTGTICPTAANFCPSDGNGYMIAAGQPLNIREYQALFSLIGYTYGGTQGVSFNLPDLRGRTPVGTGQGSGLSLVKVAAQRGAEQAAMTTLNMANHNHGATFEPTGLSVTVPVSTSPTSPTPVSSPDPAHNYLSASPVNGSQSAAIWTNSTVEIASIGKTSNSVSGVAGNIALSPAGSGNTAPVATLSPQLGLIYCIATTGNYPINPN